MVKVDLLGLGMMAVLKDYLELIPAHYGHAVDLAQVPNGDEEVYATLRRSDTVGMFQVESRAQMASLPRNGPREFYDVVVQVAIIRPRPIVGKMMHLYTRRRQGKEEITYPHSLLEEVLHRTLGCHCSGAVAENCDDHGGLYRLGSGGVAQGCGDATLYSAHERAGNKTAHRHEQKRDLLEVQYSVVQSISSFALYGFPESHAASFALIAYASAYFKVKYLAAFTCAILNNQPMRFILRRCW